jgi:Transglycosylase-like domain
MAGRHRRPSHTTLRLARVGALTVMATAPLAVTGTALAAPSHGGDSDEPSRWTLRADDELADHDDSGRDDDSARDDDSGRKDDSGNSDDSADHSVDDLPRWSDYRHGLSDSRSDEDSPVSSAAARARAAQRAPESAGTTTQDAKWDQLAQCESGRNWDANTGNSYKGGLQFSDSTWRAYGGRQYAPSANQASREQQIAVAKKVQRAQGWHAWPSCSKRLGYT